MVMIFVIFISKISLLPITGVLNILGGYLTSVGTLYSCKGEVCVYIYICVRVCVYFLHTLSRGS